MPFSIAGIGCDTAENEPSKVCVTNQPSIPAPARPPPSPPVDVFVDTVYRENVFDEN